MSINDTPFIRETFLGFDVEEIGTSWSLSTASTGGAKKFTELIIRN